MTIVKLVPQDFELVSGNDKQLNFSTLDQDDAIVDLLGAIITWAMSEQASNKARLITYTSPTNVTITDAAKGLFRVDIDAADTEALLARDYYHEARVTSSAGKKTTVATGTVKLLDNVIDI